jgi:3-hydroxy acid dehydrogenase/malonic semialdehyde reductase
MKQSIALITGATSGFGEAIALKLAENGCRVIITGRRKDRLEKLEQKLQNQGTDVLALCFDVRSEEAVNAAISSIPENWKQIDILVNNAGLASGRGPIQSGDSDDWDKMIDTNVKGLLYVSRAILPGMCERKSGHVLNMGSIAGKEAYPGGNVYCASKFAVDAISKSMRIDLLPFGIKVTQISPGAAETEFGIVRFHGDAAKAKAVYEGFDPLVAQDIAEIAWFALSRPAHVCLNDIVVMPTAQANAVQFHRNLPS